MMQKTKILLCTALMLLFPALAKADPPDPKAFLESVYSHYEGGGTPLEPQGKDADWLFDNGLLALIRQDQSQAKQANEVPILDGDPICGCQGHVDFTDLDIDATPTDTTHAGATVSFDNGDDHVSLKYELVLIGSSWKIHDITDEDNGSLREMLIKELADDQSDENSDSGLKLRKN